ncbi:MAG: alpha/beta fold hydrolase [Acidobacteriota bacterium]
MKPSTAFLRSKQLLGLSSLLLLSLPLLFGPGAANAQETSAQEPAAAPAIPSPMEMLAIFSRTQLQAQGFQRQSATVAGEDLVWWEKGEGQPLVFLHGVNDQAGTWAGVIGGLVSSHRVLLLDLPGHGESGPQEGPLTMATVLEGVEAWLAQEAPGGESEGGSAPVLVGNSMGAWVSLLVAHRQPPSVSRVVAINGGPLPPETDGLDLLPADRDEAKKLMEALRDPASEAIPAVILDDLVRRAPTSQAQRMTGEGSDLASYWLSAEAVATITTPVDLLWGISDRLMGTDYPQRLLEALPNAQLTALETCGHVPQVECPAAALQGLTDVLTSAAPSP